MLKKIAVLLALILSLTGCSKMPVIAPIETPEAAVLNAVAELPTIGAVISRYDDGFLSFVRSYMDITTEGRAKLDMLDCRGSQDKQLKLIDTMIGKGVQALAVNLVDANAAQQVIDKAKAAGLPVIFFETEPDVQALASYDQAWYVGTTPSETEKVASSVVARVWRENPNYDRNGDGKVQIMLLGPSSKLGIEKALIASGLRIEVIATDDTITTQQQAAATMKTLLEEHKKTVEYVLCTNDYLALGAVDALMKAGFYNSDGSTMPVVGMQAIPQSLELIRQGQMQGTVLKDARSIASAVTDLAYNTAMGLAPLQDTAWEMDSSKTIRIPYQAVLSDNLEQAMQAFS